MFSVVDSSRVIGWDRTQALYHREITQLEMRQLRIGMQLIEQYYNEQGEAENSKDQMVRKLMMM